MEEGRDSPTESEDSTVVLRCVRNRMCLYVPLA